MDIEQIKREVIDYLAETREFAFSFSDIHDAIDYLHSRGYFGGVPDVIWVSTPPYYAVYLEKDNHDDTRYLRAEPVEELLKNAWEALDNIAGDMYDDSEIRPILTAIDKFLGETK